MDEQQYETSKMKVNSCGVIPVKARATGVNLDPE
jgi:hypothetical protein